MAIEPTKKGKIYLLDPMGKSGLTGTDTITGICVESGTRKSTFMCTTAVDKFITLPNKYVVEIDPNCIEAINQTPVIRTLYPIRFDKMDIDVLNASISLIKSEKYSNDEMLQKLSTMLKFLKIKLERCVQAENDNHEYEVFYRTLSPLAFNSKPSNDNKQTKRKNEQENKGDNIGPNIYNIKFSRPLSPKDIDDIDFVIRVLMEGLIERKVIPHIRDEMIERSEKLKCKPSCFILDNLIQSVVECIGKSDYSDIAVPVIMYCPPYDNDDFDISYFYINHITREVSYQDMNTAIKEIIIDNLDDDDLQQYYITHEIPIYFHMTNIFIPVSLIYNTIEEGKEKTISIINNLIDKETEDKDDDN